MPYLREDRQRVGLRRRVGHRRAGGDHREIVARHVGNDQADDAGGRGGDREAAALDRRQMLAHAIHLADMRAAAQQRAIDRLLVGERDVAGGQREQRRAAAGDEAEHEIVRPEALDEFEDRARRPSGPAASGTGWLASTTLMRLRRRAMAVARDDEALERAAPMRLDGGGHRGGGLAGADDDRAPLGRGRQMRRHAKRRRGGVHRRVEHGAQQTPR